jgi:exopolysaccharide production protein ExoQ
MATDGHALSFREVKLRLAPWVVESAFVALLLLAFVGLSPFLPPKTVSQFGGVAETGAGDALRQVCYLTVFAVLSLGALQKRGFSFLRAVPVVLALLLLWCAASAAWAAEPAIAFRRAGLEIVLVVCVMLGVDTVGAERSLALWRAVLVGVLVVNWLSIPLIHTAVHNGGEEDPGLVGDWRGLYGHKNIAGAVAAMTLILFFFSAIETKRIADIAIAILAAGFLVMTRSKSSLGLLAPALAAGLVYRYFWRRGIDRIIVVLVGILVVGALGVFAFVNADLIARVLEDPAEFTGRAAIWQAELAYIHDHALLGAGFGTFSNTGGVSPLHAYVSNGDWVNAVSHGHSGYLQLLVTVGSVGFALAIVSLIAAPLLAFWPIDRAHGKTRAALFAIFVFLVFHNVMESDFLEGDGTTWVAFLLMLAMLGALRREAKEAS